MTTAGRSPDSGDPSSDTTQQQAEPARPAPSPQGGGGKPSLRRSLQIFRNPRFRLVWGSSTLSFTAMQMQQVMQPLLAWQLTGSFAWMGVISLSVGAPMLLFSLIGGAIADRVDKRNLSLTLGVLSAALMLVTAALIATDVITIEILFVLGLIQGTTVALALPARTPLLVEAVGPQAMASAIALSGASQNATRLVGPGIAGVLILLTGGLAAAYFAKAIFYVAASGVLIPVPAGLSARARAAAGPAQAQQAQEQHGLPTIARNVFKDIGRGLAYIAREPMLRLLVIMMFISTIFALPHVVLLAGFVQTDLERGPEVFAYLTAISAVGAVAGSLIVASLAEHQRKPLIQWLVGLSMAVGLVILAAGSWAVGLPATVVAVVWLALAITMYQTINVTMLMESAAPEYYGRIMSINMLTFSTMPLMILPLGAIADRVGVGELFLGQAAIIVGAMLLIALIYPRYTFRRRTPPGQEEAPPAPDAEVFEPVPDDAAEAPAR
jgi:MFS family permease